MAVKVVTRTLPNTYFELVKQFPLTHLRDDDHLDAAQAVIDRLLQEDRDEGAQAYLDVLTDLVESYEDAHVPILDASEAEDRPPADDAEAVVPYRSLHDRHRRPDHRHPAAARHHHGAARSGGDAPTRAAAPFTSTASSCSTLSAGASSVGALFGKPSMKRITGTMRTT